MRGAYGFVLFSAFLCFLLHAKGCWVLDALVVVTRQHPLRCCSLSLSLSLSRSLFFFPPPLSWTRYTVVCNGGGWLVFFFSFVCVCVCSVVFFSGFDSAFKDAVLNAESTYLYSFVYYIFVYLVIYDFFFSSPLPLCCCCCCFLRGCFLPLLFYSLLFGLHCFSFLFLFFLIRII